MRSQFRFGASASVIAVAVFAFTPMASAQTNPEPPEYGGQDETNQVEDIVVTGTRFQGRLLTQSPVPIDRISGEDLRRGGAVALTDILKSEVPSFSAPRPATAGAVDFYTAPSLRGLSPGQLLVLINGKRRHSTGDLSNHNQVGRGDVAYDLNAIPAAAIGRLEVLRDGAAAQYGADAVAGVLNLVLADDLGSGITTTYSVTDVGDGETSDTNAWIGLPLFNEGRLRATLSYRTAEGTDRALADTRQQYFGSNGTRTASAFFGSGVGLTPANGSLDPREATVDRGGFRLGEPDYDQASLFLNARVPLNANAEIYGFGGYSRLEGNSIGFVRRAAQDETVRALHPDGYAPVLNTQLDNRSLAVGLRGDDLFGFGYDLSSVFGGSAIDLTQRKSNNPSLGAASPTESHRGGIEFDQWTTNFDLTRDLPVGGDEPLRLAFGLEYREETYRLIAGDLASYVNGGQPILDGPNRGRPAPIGFQATSGILPSEARTETRDSYAAYVELEKTFGALLISAAARYEDFSDFGDTTNYKLAARYEVSPTLAIRGSASTGFRAPHLAQSFFSTTSNTLINGNLTSPRLLPVNDPVARILGSSDLMPEESTNFSVGAVATVGGLTASVDLYRIEIEDRIVLSSTFQDARITALLAQNGLTGIASASYLTNAIDTTSQGIDLTARYVHDADALGRFTATLAANYNEQALDRIAGTPAPLAALGIRTPLFDLTQQIRVTEGTPRDKQVFDLTWDRGDFSANLNVTRYGEVSAVAFTNLTPAQIAILTPGYDVRIRPTDPVSGNSQVIQDFGAEIISDLELTWRATERVEAAIGVSNLFDVYPERNIASTPQSVAAGTNGSDNAGIFPYNYVSPFGYNGRSFFLKLGYRF